MLDNRLPFGGTIGGRLTHFQKLRFSKIQTNHLFTSPLDALKVCYPKHCLLTIFLVQITSSLSQLHLANLLSHDLITKYLSYLTLPHTQ